MEHMKLAGEKATKTTAALSRLMPNVGGPRPIKRKLLASVVHSQLLYAAPVWSSSLVFQNHRKILLGPQRIMALRVASAYRTVSAATLLIVTGIVPVHLMERGRCELRRLQKTGLINAKRTVDENASRAHGATGYFIAQFLTGHGCFQANLHRFGKVDSPGCRSCGDPVDDAEHTFFRLITRKLIGKQPILGLTLPNPLQDIIRGLFPTRYFVELQIPPKTETIEPVTAGKLMKLDNAIPSFKSGYGSEGSNIEKAGRS
ncbi:hypothetical protein QTP88_020461 [Uroleucon formosanum]